ncbi:hypothetical protein GCM10009410_05810 [Shewanella ulleungensis]|uniref:Uncharacterized protein n=1 Tax=Shewanella ulleungensis TaxID=2282699 RepID=A0ABQ2QEW0_9GAMM|nr:hypothetical protein GCM10009410_05810 [Shewanella ulleungensis]
MTLIFTMLIKVSELSASNQTLAKAMKTSYVTCTNLGGQFFWVFMPMVIGTLLIFNALKQWVVKTDRLTEV